MGTLGLILFCLLVAPLGYFFGADSRPGFSDGRTDYKERWFIHGGRD